MRLVLALSLWLGGCAAGQAEADLTLDGPAHVSVDALGPVEGPVAVLADGTEIAEVAWVAQPEDVARVEGGRVVAVGPGEAVVTGAWQGQEVSWTLVVEPAVQLRFVQPPAVLSVDQQRPLTVEARLADALLTPPELQWSSHDPDIVAVSSEGEVRGVAPGVAYVTVSSGRASAMLEIEVVD